MVQDIQRKLEWAFSDLKFEEEKHIYTLNGVPLPSVSSLIKKHETYVDFTEIANKIAERKEVPVEKIQEDWEIIKNNACTLGTNTHNYAELEYKKRKPVNALEEAAEKFLDTLPSYYTIVAKELRMFSKDLKYAGTADLILWDSRVNKLVIADYKTNKDLYKSYQNLQGIFSHLKQNNFNKYQLQLSYYQILLEQAGFEVSHRAIIWLQRDGGFEVLCTKDYTKELMGHLINNLN